MRTTGAGSTSFTSTVMGHATGERANGGGSGARNPKKKGYVRLRTTHGDLNVELHCDVAPRTCENFIVLCASGYYDGVAFHRSIKNFMIQGGDPSGTGTGGQCIWGGKFKDDSPSRTRVGACSRWQTRDRTRGSQFFVLYKSASHLDGKHSVFGNVVGGMDTLARMERVPTDDKDRPTTPVVVEGVEVFVDPYADMAAEEEAEEAAAKAKEDKEARERSEAMNPGKWWSNPAEEAAREDERRGVAAPKATGTGVGKFLTKRPAEGGANGDAPAAAAKRSKPAGGYGNFDAW